MIDDIVNIVAGLVVGLLVGYLFERRATKATEANNDDLRRELNTLRSELESATDSLRLALYAAGSGDPEATTPSFRDRTPRTLVTDVHSFVCRAQGFDGRVARSKVVHHFTNDGCEPAMIEEALTTLRESGVIVIDKSWIEVQ